MLFIVPRYQTEEFILHALSSANDPSSTWHTPTTTVNQRLHTPGECNHRLFVCLNSGTLIYYSSASLYLPFSSPSSSSSLTHPYLPFSISSLLTSTQLSIRVTIANTSCHLRDSLTMSSGLFPPTTSLQTPLIDHSIMVPLEIPPFFDPKA